MPNKPKYELITSAFFNRKGLPYEEALKQHQCYTIAQPYHILYPEHDIIKNMISKLYATLEHFGLPIDKINNRAANELFSTYFLYLASGEVDDTQYMSGIYFFLLMHRDLHPEMLPDYSDHQMLLFADEFMDKLNFDVSPYPVDYDPTGYELIYVMRENGYIGFHCVGDKRLVGV